VRNLECSTRSFHDSLAAMRRSKRRGAGERGAPDAAREERLDALRFEADRRGLRTAADWEPRPATAGARTRLLRAADSQAAAVDLGGAALLLRRRRSEPID